MPEEVPPATVAKNASAGTLPISALNNTSKGTSQRSQAARQPAVKLKVVIRRLPPGLTEAEFEKALGSDWKVSAGRVSWAVYKQGKISKDAAKSSRPSRAYFQLTEQAHLEALASHVQSTSFADARNTAGDAALIGPPALEFAIYQRIPTSKKRNDARQGLIDQDPEFIEFLESLTNPTVKPPNIDAMTKEAKDEPVQSTPLIQHLREKKAAKEKAKSEKGAKAARAAKGDAAETKAESKTKENDKAESKSSRRRKADASKKDTAAQPAPKVQSVATPAKADSAKPVAEVKKKERPASVAGATAASLIQRDLGIRGGGRGEGSRHAGSTRAKAKGTAKENAQSNATAADGNPSTKPETSKKNKSSPAPPSPSPTVLKRQPQETAAQPAQSAKASAATKNTPTPSQVKSSSATQPATKAFLKHANPSQGITEANLQEALSVYGVVSKVEIDKRKGFAYAEFAEPLGLQAAIAAGLLKVAEGNVQVMERKERPKANGNASAGPAASSNAPSKNNSTPAASANSNAGAKSSSGTRGGRSGRGRGNNARGSAQQSSGATKANADSKDAAAASAPPPATVPAKSSEAT